jgi:hypothetical protein
MMLIMTNLGGAKIKFRKGANYSCRNHDRRDAEKGAATELSKLAQKFKFSLEEWRISIAELAKWIRYTPPPADAVQGKQPFEELPDEDGEGGPETIH